MKLCQDIIIIIEGLVQLLYQDLSFEALSGYYYNYNRRTCKNVISRFKLCDDIIIVGVVMIWVMTI